MAVATIATTLSVLPVFLLGGLAVLIRAELGFNEAALGSAVGIFFGSVVMVAGLGGILADRFGPRHTILLAGTMSALTLIAIASVVRSWLSLVVVLAFGGIANGLAQPASNLLLAREVQVRYQGLAFGVKQAAVPVASMLAGIAVPILGMTVGWRWAFALASVGALAVFGTIPKGYAPTRNATTDEESRGGFSDLHLAVLAVAAGLGIAGATSLGVFVIETAVARGATLGFGGMLLAIGSASTIIARVAGGWLADQRERGHLAVLSGMLAVGAIGMLILALAHSPTWLLLGTILGFGVGWGWSGLFFYAIVRLSPDAPGRASGFGLAGASAGAVVGPTLFGLGVVHASYAVAWTTAAAASALAAALVALSRRSIRVRNQVVNSTGR